MPQKVVRNRGEVRLNKLPVFIIILMIIGVLLAIILMFIDFAKTETAKENVFDIPSPPVSVAVSTPSAVPTPLPSSSSDEESSSSESGETYEKVAFSGTAVPKTQAVDDSYFDDAVFIGDSISKGLKLYGVLPESNVIADQNVGLDQIYLNKDVYYISATQKTTLWNALDQRSFTPAKIYVMLGANGIPGYENEKHITFYYDLLDKLIEKYPDATIYIESLTPITKATSQKRSPNFTKEKIDDFNERIYKMAEEKNVYFLDVEEVLKDENGYLKSEYDGGDGTHMPKAGHQAVYGYLKTHAVLDGGYIMAAK